MINPNLVSAWISSPQWLGMGGFLGALAGGAVAGLTTMGLAWVLAKRLHRMRVLDHARRELKGPLHDYVEWLHTLSAEFSVWRHDLVPTYRSGNARDQFELNRMRKLFVDPRNTLWFSRLEEYDTMLQKFSKVIQAMWVRQAEIAENFNRVLHQIETIPEEATSAASKLEALSFEQSQLVSDFVYHLQYECLRSVAARAPRRPRDARKARIVRTTLGAIRVIEPALHTMRSLTL